jgi:hypothetical protein
VDARRCEATKADGSPCRAAALPGRPHCLFHDPGSRETREAGRTAGGKSRSRLAAVRPADTPDFPLSTPGEVRAALAACINLTLKGKLDPKVSNATCYLAATLLRSIEGDELERRIKALEEAQEGRAGR